MKGVPQSVFASQWGIGDDADKVVLGKFIENTPYLAQQGENKIPNKVFYANDASSVHKFFQKVTMSVTSRSRSNKPNEIPPVSPDDEDKGYW